MIKSIQAEDKGTYICTIKQPRGSESSSEKSQSISVMVIGKMKKYLTIIPRARMGSESIAHEAEGRMGY